MYALSPPGARYRLVIQNQNNARDERVYAHYKQAVSSIAGVVREHAAFTAPPDRVVLQCGTPADDSSVNLHTDAYFDGAGWCWVSVESWGPDVVTRILDQDTHRRHPRLTWDAWRDATRPAICNAVPSAAESSHNTPTAPERNPTPTLPAPEASTSATPTARSRTGVGRHSGRGSYVAVSALIVVLAWVAMVWFMTGGHLGELLEANALADREPISAEVHFAPDDAPIPASPIPCTDSE